MVLGNGGMGVMIWGGGNVLRVTFNRGDFWDHRGDLPWVQGMSYRRIRELLEMCDEEGLRTLFERAEPPPGHPRRPSLLPLGRIKLILRPGVRLTSGCIQMEQGRILVYAEEHRRGYEIALDLSVAEPLLYIPLSDGLPLDCLGLITSWEYVSDTLRSISFEELLLFEDENLTSWVQPRPADTPLRVGYRLVGDGVWLTLVYGNDVADAKAGALRRIADVVRRGGATATP